MTSLVVSTIVYFVATYFIKRRLDQYDIPKSLTRAALIFVLALAVAYGVAAVVDWLIG